MTGAGEEGSGISHAQKRSEFPFGFVGPLNVKKSLVHRDDRSHRLSFAKGVHCERFKGGNSLIEVSASPHLD
jgi:hypothetical protein